MKSRMFFYPMLRADYDTMEELCAIINRSRSYVAERMSGKRDFTYREMCILARAVGLTDADAREYCRKE